MTIATEKHGNKEKSVFVYSFDPKNEKMYFTLKSEETVLKMKLFKVNGHPYIFTSVNTKTDSDGGTVTFEKDEYYSAQEECVKLFTNIKSFSYFSEQDITSLFRDYTFGFEETKIAYESVYAEQLANEIKSDDLAGANFSMSAKKLLGASSFEFYSQRKKGDFNVRGDYGQYTLTEKEKIVSKQGKISQLSVENELSFSPSYEDYSSSPEKIAIEIEIDYSFDESGYRKIKTKLPDYVELYEYSENFRMRFNINGFVTERSATAYSFNPEYIFKDLTKDFRGRGYTVQWYEDEAYSKPFTVKDLTYEQFHEIEQLYGKLSVYENFAVIGQDYCVRDDRSDSYKIVFGPVFERTLSYEILEAKGLSSESTYVLPWMSDEFETSVNGTPYDENFLTLPLENSTFYHVKCLEVFTNERYSIFDFDTSLF